MTAEIAILNKESVALAADSAVTIGESEDKIYNSANKLFALSKFHPVGIMISGSANFMGTPWETIIKEFRNQLYDESYYHLEDYANEFINFTETNKLGISEEFQSSYVEQVAWSIFAQIKREIRERTDEYISQNVKTDIDQTKKIVSKVIDEIYQTFSKRPDLDNLPDNYVKNLKKNFKKEISGAIYVFENLPERLPLNKKNENKLFELPFFILSKKIFPEKPTSEVVIAGFGDKDIFPALISYEIESRVLNKVKYNLPKENIYRMSDHSSPLIAPFAQSEMVYTFMRGIDPNLKESIENSLKTRFKQFSKEITNNLQGIKDETDAKKKRFENKLNKKVFEILEQFKGDIKEQFVDKHVSSILTSVGVLPKNELANMAEVLVHLTLFKRRVAFDQKETVGGAIDVAVISKGDGFIWIKRKHYFKPEYNPWFLKTYFKKYKRGEKNEN